MTDHDDAIPAHLVDQAADLGLTIVPAGNRFQLATVTSGARVGRHHDLDRIEAELAARAASISGRSTSALWTPSRETHCTPSR
ncbi:hypothetical protein [Williamsia serinedens]|uniref:hypothetical protein n=1 Tax=Williamsia serinedens TaxID=391736 RepID=UPI0020A28619|nr:hypothetical protein [Williamsia serinedens]